MEKPEYLKIWQVVAGIVAAAAIVFLFNRPSPVSSDIASCETDHPANVVMCVDLGAGHHELPIPRQPLN